MVFLISVLSHRFGIVAGFAKRLPIFSVPKKFLISTVGCDVIDHGCLHITSSCKTANTQWMGLKINSSCLTPTAAISFLRCGFHIMAVEGLMFLAVHCPIWNQPTTAGMLAWSVRSARHGKHVLSCSSQLHGQCHESLQSHLQPESGP